MNRDARGFSMMESSVPRVCGDEPAPDTEVAEAMSAVAERACDTVATVYLADDAFDANDEDEDRAMREAYVQFVESLGLEISRKRWVGDGSDDDAEAARDRDSELYVEWHALWSATEDLDAIVGQYRADNNLADDELPVGYCPQSDARRALRIFCESKKLCGYGND